MQLYSIENSIELMGRLGLWPPSWVGCGKECWLVPIFRADIHDVSIALTHVCHIQRFCRWCRWLNGSLVKMLAIIRSIPARTKIFISFSYTLVFTVICNVFNLTFILIITCTCTSLHMHIFMWSYITCITHMRAHTARLVLQFWLWELKTYYSKYVKDMV